MIKESGFYSPEKKEQEPKNIVVEIGPAGRPLIYLMEKDNEEGISYKAGDKKRKELFSLKSGDMLIEVDLPPLRNINVFNQTWMHGNDLGKSHLSRIQKELEKRLPRGIKSAVLHADGQKLPFADEQIDTVFMANVLSGQVKDDEMGGFKAGPKHILREKENLIKEIKRVLKVGGKLILENEYAPAESVRATYKKIMNDLEDDPDFDFRIVADPSRDGSESWQLVIELIKRQDLKK